MERTQEFAVKIRLHVTGCHECGKEILIAGGNTDDYVRRQIEAQGGVIAQNNLASQYGRHYICPDCAKKVEVVERWCIQCKQSKQHRYEFVQMDREGVRGICSDCYNKLPGWQFDDAIRELLNTEDTD
jgi:hypothetical protein